jgi:hypothetical protein
MSGGSYNCTLNNGPTYNSGSGGSIVFNGTNQYVANSSLPNTLLGDPSFTISGWFKLNANFTNNSTWGFGGSSAGPDNINSYAIIQNEIAISLANTSVLGTGQLYDSSWKYIVWTKVSGVFNRTNIHIYINGIDYTGANLVNRFGNETTNPNITSNGFSIAKSNSSSNIGAQLAGIYCSNFQAYDRALSLAEIQQNYNTQKSRFNL